MRVGELELETTAEEVDEVAGIIHPLITADTAQGDTLAPSILASETFGQLPPTYIGTLLGGILIGAHLYHRRLREAGERMMADVSDADLAQVMALEGREARPEPRTACNRKADSGTSPDWCTEHWRSVWRCVAELEAQNPADNDNNN